MRRARHAQGALQHLPHHHAQAHAGACPTSTHEAYDAVKRLFARIELGGRLVRLVGVTVSGLFSNAFQLTFDEQWSDVALGDAVDRVRAKYGKRALRLAAALSLPATGTAMC